MFHPRTKLFALLASTYILPLANAECSPYLNEKPNETSQEPEKCWICPTKGNNGFQSAYEALPDWENEATKSWDNFYCKYVNNGNEGLDPNGNPYKRSTIFCQYNNKGELRAKDANCPTKAIPKPNCTPSRPYSGPPQICCGDGCKLETDQCYTCPPMPDTLYVDVAVNPNILACFGTYKNVAGPSFYFDAQTGNLLMSSEKSPPSKAPLRAGCVSKPVAVPGAKCAAGATHDQCVREAQQDAYRSFNTWNRCRPQEDYCKHRTMSTSCWACPRIAGTDAVEEKDEGSREGTCTYFKRNASGVLESANTVCSYYLGVGGELVPDGVGKGNVLTCPPQSDQDLTCARLKKAAGK